MKRAILAGFFVLACAGLALGQTASSTIDVLGAHNNGGRGCAGCHAPHSGAFGSGNPLKGGSADAGSYALWGQDASPLYGQTIAFGDNGNFKEVLPTTIKGGGEEVGGILLCLSCHDGNLTPRNMMTNQSYEQKIGLLTNKAYGANPIPTLLGNDGTTAGNYNNDHPVGTPSCPALPCDGEFSQTIDATKLNKGLHFIEVRVFRHRTDGGPAIFTSLKKVISVARP